MTDLMETHTPVGAPLESPASRPSWVASRVSKTSDSLDRAFEEGLTGHVITARDGKRVSELVSAAPRPFAQPGSR